MCKRAILRYDCGHQAGSQAFNPDTAEECSVAVEANQLNAGGYLKRCPMNPNNTTYYHVGGNCSRPECVLWARLQAGWYCCACGLNMAVKAGEKYAEKACSFCKHSHCQDCIPTVAKEEV